MSNAAMTHETVREKKHALAMNQNQSEKVMVPYAFQMNVKSPLIERFAVRTEKNGQNMLQSVRLMHFDGVFER